MFIDCVELFAGQVAMSATISAGAGQLQVAGVVACMTMVRIAMQVSIAPSLSIYPDGAGIDAAAFLPRSR